MSAIDDVVAERKRQILVEGWSDGHDDQYLDSELVAAAITYAMCAVVRDIGDDVSTPADIWPWDLKWWKPKNRRDDLVRAAALIVAEIDRMDRVLRSR